MVTDMKQAGVVALPGLEIMQTSLPHLALPLPQSRLSLTSPVYLVQFNLVILVYTTHFCETKLLSSKLPLLHD